MPSDILKTLRLSSGPGRVAPGRQGFGRRITAPVLPDDPAGTSAKPALTSRNPHDYPDSHTTIHCRLVENRVKLAARTTRNDRQRGKPMQLQVLNPTRILSPLFASVGLKGGAVDGRLADPPPAVLADGASVRHADLNLTPSTNLRVYDRV